MGEFANNVKKKVAEAGKKVVSGAENALKAVSDETRNNAESNVREEHIQIPESAKIEHVEYTLQGASVEEFKKMEADASEQIDFELTRIENVAFKHAFFDINRNYSAQFSLVKKEEDKYVVCVDSPDKCMRGVMLNKIVYDKEELQHDKLNNVFSSVVKTGCTLAMIIYRTHSDCIISFVTKSNETDDQSRSAINTRDTFKDVFLGNFPGSEMRSFEGGDGIPDMYNSLSEVSSTGTSFERGKYLSGFAAKFRDKEIEDYSVTNLFDEVFSSENSNAISGFIGVPSIKTEGTKYINQGVEKLIDGVVPPEGQAYTVILLAEPLTPEGLSSIRGGYEDLASIISPYQEAQYNLSYSEMQAKNTQFSDQVSKQVNISTNYAMGIGAHAGAGASVAASGGVSAPKDGSQSVTKNVRDGDLGERIWNGGHNFFKGGEKITSVTSPATMENVSFNGGANATIGANIHADLAENIASGRSYASTQTFGDSENKGESRGITYHYTSSRVRNIYQRLDKEIQRLNKSENAGVWKFAGFTIASERALSQKVANIYQGLIQGDQSDAERMAINTWNKGKDYDAIMSSILSLRIPTFTRKEDDKDEKDKRDVLPKMVSYSTEVSSPELALIMNLPQKAIPGIPVLSFASFGRNVCTLDGKKQSQDGGVTIGNLYHLSNIEKSTPIFINREKLKAHVFITGTTGVGKSNAIYQVLGEVVKPKKNEDKVYATSKDVHFMVIEPTKGEYKDIFGGWENVDVYGTNPRISNVLTINPFAFPCDIIHVHEHIDRLVGIFNACWPMYAAMPAILKDAIEEAYRSVGWDLDASTCDNMRFPSFWDLLYVLPDTVKKSHYSADTNSDYIGALVTRVNSLTNGLDGVIFNSVNCLTDAQLFERNTIIDISMANSPETKALIMGVLVLKLQEYHIDKRLRNAETIVANEELNHITVLEEAHLLLRKTSMEQSQEGANLQGKSVEMLSNAIAEMRTYGESFIIADQAPSSLDTSVIRNTNTKIVMRLPELNDRNVMGGALALNELQTRELAKLPNWVGAVYQSDWLEPVLCMTLQFDKDNQYSKRYIRVNAPNSYEQSLLGVFLTKIALSQKCMELTKEKKNIVRILNSIVRIEEYDEQLIEKFFNNEVLLDNEKRTLEYDLIGGNRLLNDLRVILDNEELMYSEYNSLMRQLSRRFGVRENEVINILINDCVQAAKEYISLNEEETILMNANIERIRKIQEVCRCQFQGRL